VGVREGLFHGARRHFPPLAGSSGRNLFSGLTRARDREAEIKGRTRIDVSPHFLDSIQMRTGGDEKEMPQA